MANTSNSKRIAKNTVLLYFRMILSMLVSLYTSRVILRVLGVDDFGIYNIVGGIVVMFSFINTFLTSASQRFLSFSLAKSNKQDTTCVFSTSLFIHVIIAIIFGVFAETVGLWFVCNKLVIPGPRFTAAIWIFHIMVIESCISIFKVPYNAAIIAEEKMDFYAYTSIVESVLRLLAVYLLVLINFDKLIIYALLHILVAFLMLLWYKTYSEKKFAYCRFSLKYNRQNLKDMTSFSAWNLFGSIADLGYKQGTNIFLNLFYGVALNAAMGIATTVRTTVYSFISNLQVAANPQIIKSYAIGEYDYYGNLINKISKYSYFLMLLLAVPVGLNIKYVLNLWLGAPPLHSDNLVVLGLIFCLIDSLHGPLWTSMQATGKIRNYQIVASLVLLLNLPLSYWALSVGYPPESIMIIQIFVSFVTLFVRIIFSKIYAHIGIRAYLKSVLIPIALVSIVSIPIPLYISTLYEDGFSKLLVTGIISIVFTVISILSLGVSNSERAMFYLVVKKKIFKNNR
ncbi:MATE family efflux transporter [Bacteroides ihuae]|uniref:hypothetical protein n=1 Tax=Bacteroides ihuae TaxID=1852362 RepID=UPI0008D98C7F|nr:hypothetical protein [Bacteroides ihuae]